MAKTKKYIRNLVNNMVQINWIEWNLLCLRNVSMLLRQCQDNLDSLKVKTCHIVCNNNNNNGVLYCALVCHTATHLAQKHYYPGFSPAACGAEALEGINSCLVPIYYTWVEKDKLWIKWLVQGHTHRAGLEPPTRWFQGKSTNH